MWAYEYLLIRYLTHTVPYAMLIRLRLVFPLTSSLSRWEFFCAVVVVPPFQFSRSLICLFVLILPSIYWWCYSSRCCGWYVTPVNIQHIICILPQSQSIRPCYSICVCVSVCSSTCLQMTFILMPNTSYKRTHTGCEFQANEFFSHFNE